MPIEVVSLTDYNNEVKGHVPPPPPPLPYIKKENKDRDEEGRTPVKAEDVEEEEEPKKKRKPRKKESKPNKQEAEEDDESFLSEAWDYLGDTAKQGIAGLADIGTGALHGVRDTVDTFKDFAGMEDEHGDFEDKLNDLGAYTRGYSREQGDPKDLAQKIVRKIGSGALMSAVPGIGKPINFISKYGEELAEQEQKMILKGWSPAKIEKEMSRLKALLSAGTRTIGLGSLDDITEAGRDIKGALSSLFTDQEEEGAAQ